MQVNLFMPMPFFRSVEIHFLLFVCFQTRKTDDNFVVSLRSKRINNEYLLFSLNFSFNGNLLIIVFLFADSQIIILLLLYYGNKYVSSLKFDL